MILDSKCFSWKKITNFIFAKFRRDTCFQRDELWPLSRQFWREYDLEDEEEVLDSEADVEGEAGT